MTDEEAQIKMEIFFKCIKKWLPFFVMVFFAFALIGLLVFLTIRSVSAQETVAPDVFFPDFNMLVGSGGEPAPLYSGNSVCSASRAYRGSTNQTIPAGAYTKIELNAETYDDLNEFDSTTNFRFTAVASHYYQVNAQISFVSAEIGKVYLAQIRRNGTAQTDFYRYPADTNGFQLFASDIIYLTAGQYLELWVYHGSVASKEVQGPNRYTFISVHDLSCLAECQAGETDPVYSAWITAPPNVSEFINDAGYLTSFGWDDLIDTSRYIVILLIGLAVFALVDFLRRFFATH